MARGRKLNAFSAIIAPAPYAGSVRRGIVPPTQVPSVQISHTADVQINASTMVIGPLDASSNNVITAAGPTATLNLASGTAGQTRWDLVYAWFTLDAADANVYRKRKDPTSKVVSVAAVSIATTNVITYGVVTGTPATSNPGLPGRPADGVNTFAIPLAYVRIPSTHVSGAGDILPEDIQECSEVYWHPSAPRPASRVAAFTGPLIGPTGVAKLQLLLA